MRNGIISKNKNGFGFVRMDEERDIYIAPDNILNSMDGDNVAVELIPEIYWKGGPEGIITKVLERNTKEIIGTLFKHKNFGKVVSKGKSVEEVYINHKDIGKAKQGDIVVAKITKYPGEHKDSTGIITEIIAKKNQKDAEILSLIREYGIRNEFSDKILKESKILSKNLVINKKKDRTDLRSELTVTIDGKDSKDFDDAVTVKINENGNYLLYVHIADVNHYVSKGSPLDVEAMLRGNSVYLYNKVIPMFPKELSNGICSLNPKEDRLTLTCKMEIDDKGVVVDYSIFESIINSDERLVYDDVSDILENEDKELKNRYSHILEMIYNMNHLSVILRKKRKAKGSLDFNMREAKIILDENDYPISIEKEVRRVANKIIEEFMLIANETVAEHFYWLEVPFIYRVHDKPDVEKINELRGFLAGFNINISSNFDSINSKLLSEVLVSIEDTKMENIINRVMLRMMKKAEYRTSCTGHYGLAFKYYCHFTSPIRRYPDLIVHRIIKNSIHNPDAIDDINELADISKHSSDMERVAIDLERKVEKYLMVQFMKDKVGKEYRGIVSGIGKTGLFIELDNTIEGFVRYDGIPGDYYIIDEKNYRAVGTKTKKSINMGDNLKIVVTDVNEKDKLIDFNIIK
ncbi:MAG TPA: ribonuclease R [Anaerovoracaceae bacterium]|nr:ribonuclease R [Anaerovoracaceae bacterium]